MVAAAPSSSLPVPGHQHLRRMENASRLPPGASIPALDHQLSPLVAASVHPTAAAAARRCSGAEVSSARARASAACRVPKGVAAPTLCSYQHASSPRVLRPPVRQQSQRLLGAALQVEEARRRAILTSAGGCRLAESSVWASENRPRMMWTQASAVRSQTVRQSAGSAIASVSAGAHDAAAAVAEPRTKWTAAAAAAWRWAPTSPRWHAAQELVAVAAPMSSRGLSAGATARNSAAVARANRRRCAGA